MRIAFLFPIVLTACAGAIQVGSPAPDPEPTIIGQGSDPANRIVVYRPSEFGPITNVATTPALTLDGRSVGTCRIGAPLVLRVPDGDWMIGALTENGTVNQVVSVSGGAERYVRCGTESAPSLGPRPVLVPVSSDTGSGEAGI
jgi:hypothetical protein